MDRHPRIIQLEAYRVDIWNKLVACNDSLREVDEKEKRQIMGRFIRFKTSIGYLGLTLEEEINAFVSQGLLALMFAIEQRQVPRSVLTEFGFEKTVEAAQGVSFAGTIYGGSITDNITDPEVPDDSGRTLCGNRAFVFADKRTQISTLLSVDYHRHLGKAFYIATVEPIQFAENSSQKFNQRIKYRDESVLAFANAIQVRAYYAWLNLG